MTALPLGLLACQDVIDWLVPGDPPQDGESRRLQVAQDPGAGSGAPGSPALLHVRARVGTHLAVRVEGGVAWELDQEPDQGRAEMCVLLPEPADDGWSRAQVLVVSSRPVYDVFVGLARFDEPSLENAAGASTGAGGESPVPGPVVSSRDLLANVCPGATIIDEETVHLEVPEVPTPEPAEGGNGGGGSGGNGGNGADAGAGGVPPEMGGQGGVTAAGAPAAGAGGAVEPPLAGGGAGGAP